MDDVTMPDAIEAEVPVVEAVAEVAAAEAVEATPEVPTEEPA